MSVHNQLAVTSDPVPKSGTLPSDTNHSMYGDALSSLIVTSADVFDVVFRYVS
jgi:hypothetical protein